MCAQKKGVTAVVKQEQIEKWDQAWARQFPRRFTRAQKESFLQTLEAELGARNFKTRRVVGRQLLACHNLVTECAAPKVILLAHYDTPTIMPFWLSWLTALVGHTRQGLAMVLLVLFLMLPSLLSMPPWLVSAIHFALWLTLLSLFIPNPHNREDNSSGVLGLMGLADWLAAHPAVQAQVQLVFLDNEEWGLLGATVQKRVWEKEGHPYQRASIINLDCISRGQVPLLVHHGEEGVAERLRPWLQKRSPALQQLDMGWLALSDNFVFRKLGAVDISYADRSLIPGGYYIPRIHSPADNSLQVEPMLPLLQGLADFLQAEADIKVTDGPLTDR